ncbi:molybdopterin-guanine dinucleotide biosynthesis protein MobB [Eubacteriaceae bacterium ES2]|nr:molybdopterin-guanine dinucleotide biosynthesis protein MobB [Eubacteriaceae bacterium ES2]
MKVISVRGLTHSGKTTVVETIINGLRRRGYSVGSVKEIHFEAFEIDQAGTNTYRHKEAGAQLVTALGMYETDILYQEKLPIRQVLAHYDYDYTILEGVNDPAIPKIVTGHDFEGLEERWDETVFAFSGLLAENYSQYRGLEIVNCLKEPNHLVDLVQENAFDLLPGFSEKCCGLCETDCAGFCRKIVARKVTRSDCPLKNDGVSLKINNEKVIMVPFVQKLIRNAVLSVVSELEGYQKGAEIKIQIGSMENDE